MDSCLSFQPRRWPRTKDEGRMAARWMDHALAYAECVGEDMKVPFGVAFPKFANAKKSETVVFSFITYKNKAHRDSVNKKSHERRTPQGGV